MPQRGTVRFIARVTVDFKPIAIRIGEIHTPPDLMIDRGNLHVGINQFSIRLREGTLIRHTECEMAQTHTTFWHRRSFGSSRIQRDLMMRATACEECDLALHDFGHSQVERAVRALWRGPTPAPCEWAVTFIVLLSVT